MIGDNLRDESKALLSPCPARCQITTMAIFTVVTLVLFIIGTSVMTSHDSQHSRTIVVSERLYETLGLTTSSPEIQLAQITDVLAQNPSLNGRNSIVQLGIAQNRARLALLSPEEQRARIRSALQVGHTTTLPPGVAPRDLGLYLHMEDSSNYLLSKKELLNDCSVCHNNYRQFHPGHIVIDDRLHMTTTLAGTTIGNDYYLSFFSQRSSSINETWRFCESDQQCPNYNIGASRHFTGYVIHTRDTDQLISMTCLPTPTWTFSTASMIVNISNTHAASSTASSGSLPHPSALNSDLTCRTSDSSRDWHPYSFISTGMAKIITWQKTTSKEYCFTTYLPSNVGDNDQYRRFHPPPSECIPVSY